MRYRIIKLVDNIYNYFQRSGRNPVGEETLIAIARSIPRDNFTSFFLRLGLKWEQINRVLSQWGNSYPSASEQLLSEWAREKNDTDVLRNTLLECDLDMLAKTYLSH